MRTPCIALSTEPARLIDVTEITVKDAGGAYATATYKGQKASSTASAQEACTRLGRKIYGKGFRHVLRCDAMPDDAANMSRWMITSKYIINASVNQEGAITFGTTVPPFHTLLATGPEDALQAVLEVLCGTCRPYLYVPGMKEAADDQAAIDALMKFAAFHRSGNGRTGRYGVEFVELERQ